MPFTGSHPAAILPLLGTPLPMSALVAGSMAPDSPAYLLGGFLEYPSHTHSVFNGVGVNLVLGLILWAAWHLLLSGPALAAAPAAIRTRCGHLGLGLRSRLRRPVDFLLVPAAIEVGALSHVLWDNFTHAWGWPVMRVPAMQAEYLGVPGWSYAQVTFSVAGLVAIAVALRRAWKRAPIGPMPAAHWGLGPLAAASWLLIAGAATVGALRGFYVGAFQGGWPSSMLPWHMLTRSIGLALTVGTVLAVLWHLRRAPALLRSRLA
ncbi:MAG: DUF4184 family protein [Sporichthyaceae bacterium]